MRHAQCADNEENEFTPAAREVGPAAKHRKCICPYLNGKLVPLAIIRVLVPLHGKLVSPLKLLKFWAQLNGKLVPQLLLAMRVQAAMIQFSMVVNPTTKPGKYGIMYLVWWGVFGYSGYSPKRLDVPNGYIAWGYTMSGSACLYISDVHKLAENDCLLLRQLAVQFPGLKWFFIGGSPCQDLTYAGYLHGLLGY